MTDIIRSEQLRKRFRVGRQTVEALRGVDISIPAGQVTGLIGHNGAGKSTFIKLALGFYVPTEGAVSVFDQPPGADEAAARLGYLPENPSFPKYLSGREILTYIGRLRGMTKADALDAAADLLAEVEIEHAADRRVGGYSKGMAQRLGLAQALIDDPELLILDEPMSGLDPIGRASVKDILRRRREAGATIVFCSHVLDDVEQLCDRIVMLARGEVVYQGAVGGVLVDGDPVWEVLIAGQPPASMAEYDWTSLGVDQYLAEFRDQGVLADILNAVASGDVQLLRVGRRSVALEDAFVRLTSRGEAQHA